MEKAKNFVPVLIRTDQRANREVGEYEVKATPTIVFTDPQGKEKDRFQGMKPTEEVLKAMDKVLAMSKKERAGSPRN